MTFKTQFKNLLKTPFKLAVLMAVLTSAAYVSAQVMQDSTRVSFELVNQEAAALVLGGDDEYVAATGDLERKAKTRSTKPIDKTAFLKYMRQTTKEWTAGERAKIERELPSLEKYVNQIAWTKPAKIQFIRVSAALEDNLPHTRGTAVILPDSAFSVPRGAFVSMLAHEVFHVLTRQNQKLKESSYKLIGFERCETVQIHPKIDQLKITNPDTPMSEHTIAVKYKGQSVDALPFIGFNNALVDTSTGFINKLSVNWLLVKRVNNQCSLEGDSLQDNSVAPESLDGLFEKIGKNTGYLFHAEEILAENFAALYMASIGGMQIQSYPSGQLLLDFKKLLFESVNE